MAYIVSVTETATATSGATYAVSLGTHTTDDLLLVCLSQDTGTTTISLGSDALTSVTAATDTFVYSGSDVFDNGIQVEFSGTLGTSLQANTRYWVRDLNVGAKSFKVSATEGGAAFDVTGSPSGVTCHRMTGGASANNNCVGWAIIGTQAASQGVRQVWAYKFATGAGTANPTFTGTNDDWLGTCLVVRDALTTWTPKWQRSDWGNSTNIASADSNVIAASSAGGTTLITCATDSLDIYSWNTDGANVYLRTTADSMIGVSKQLAACGHIIGYRQHGASGNPTSVTAYCNTFNEGGNGWVLSIDNKVGGMLEKDCRAGTTNVSWYGDFNLIAKQATVTISNATPAVVTYTAPTTDMWSNGQPVYFTTTGALPTGLTANTVYFVTGVNTGTNTFNVEATIGGGAIATSSAGSGTHSAFHTLANPAILAASINSITCSTTNPTITTNLRPARSPWGAFSSLTSTQNTAGNWVGGVDVIPATDMTNKIFAIQWQVDFNSTSAFVGANGVIVVFGDGTNYAAYQLSAAANYVNINLEQNFIALGQGTTYATSGSINWAAVTQLGYFYHRIGSTASSGSLSIRNATLLGTSTITGGGASRPVDFVILNDALNFWGGFDLVQKQGATQILGKGSVQIGDGTLYTYFDSSAGAFAYPLAYLGTDIEQKKWNVPASQTGLSLSVYAASGDTINLAAGATTTDTLQALTINASSNTGATYSFAGNSFVGWTPTWKTGIACANATFKKCATVAFKGAAPNTVSISNCDTSINSTTGAACSFDTNSTMSSSTINVAKEDGTNCGYHISLGSSVTAMTLNGITLSGTPGTDKIYSDYPETTVAATAMVNDRYYQIKTAGTTVWTSFGAADNNVGTKFKKTGGAGTGTGDAYAGIVITVDGTGTALSASDVTTTTANVPVLIASPAVYQSVVISGFVAGSRLQIYDVDYNFTVTGVSVYPAAGQTYEDPNGVVFTVISSGSGVIHAYGVTSPKLTGTLTLTKTSGGTGDATITYTACSDDGEELFNGTASAGNTVISGSTATWTDSIAAAANRYIRLRRSYVTASTASNFLEQIIGTCGTTDGSESVTYLDSPTTDTTYEYNGIDGSGVSTVTFTDAATDLVNCNVPGGSITLQSIYAAFVYWFFTSTGIADDIAYAESPDPANYLFTSTKIKNTSSGPVVPLMITGGYVRDALTGLSSDVVDTSGGSIFLSPDHVVAYATGSGALTAGDITNIWANASRTLTTTIPTASDVATQVLTSAQSTPIYADARKMNGATITGTGVDSDLWRGA